MIEANEKLGYENNPIINEVKDFLKDKMSIMFAFEEALLVPQYDEKIPTAAVKFSIDENVKNIGLVFNPDFWKSLNENEKCFVFAHEIMHIMLNHGRRGKAFADEIGKNFASIMKILNIAMDICINEILFAQYFAYVPKTDFPIIANFVCTIESVFGDKKDEIKPHQNFIYYYYKIVENFTPEELEAMEMGFDGVVDFSELGEEGDQIVDAICNGFLEESEEIEKGANPDGSSGGYVMGGSRSSGSFKDVVTAGTLDECLKDVIGSSGKSMDYKIHTNWYKTNRRTIGVISPKFTVPVYAYTKPQHIPKILVYADVSGSVSYISDKFFALINKIDFTKYDVDTYAWASYVSTSKVDLDSKKYHGTGGGTAIANVFEHHKKLSEKYDAVIVLTDGEYTNVTRMHDSKFKSWHFFFTRESRNAPLEAKKYKLTKW